MFSNVNKVQKLASTHPWLCACAQGAPIANSVAQSAANQDPKQRELEPTSQTDRQHILHPLRQYVIVMRGRFGE